MNFLSRRAEVLPSNGIKKGAAFSTVSRNDESLISGAIPFNEENRNAFIEEVFHRGHTSSKFRDRKIYITDEAFRYHLRRLYIALDAYIEAPNAVLKPSEILWGCASGPKYAKYLKTLRLLSYLKSQELDVLHSPKEYDNIPRYQISDIGDIFNYQHLFHWEEDSDDWKDGLIPVPDIKQSDLTIFEEKLRLLLPAGVQRVDPREILLDVTSSSSTTTDGFPSKQWKERGIDTGMNFSSSPLKGRRVQIQIGPGNVRDTVVLPLDQVNSVRYIDAQVWEILSHMPGHAMHRNPDTQSNIIESLWSSKNFFYCRDLQKEGITKPRRLILSILKVLSERYPELEAFQYRGIYEGYTLLFPDGKEVDLVRGHGLGMANSITTLMNIVIFHLTIDEIWRYETLVGEVDSLSYNDDFVAGFTHQSDMEEYYSLEDDVLTRYGLIRKPEKSFKGHKSFVFMEVYKPHSLNRKESYKRREVMNSLLCYNVVHAKEYINSLSARVEPELLWEYLPEIIGSFGFEFFQGEERLPHSLGGWIGYRFREVSLDLKVYYDLPRDFYDARVYRCYKAARTSVTLTKKGLRKHYRSPLEFLIPLSIEVKDPLFRARFYLEQTYSDMSNTFENILRSQGLSQLYWDRLRMKREQTYKEYPNMYDPLQSYEEICRDYPYDFIAPLALPHERFSVIESEFIRPLDLYRLNINPLVAGISGYTGLKYKDIYPSKYECVAAGRRRFHRLEGSSCTSYFCDTWSSLPSRDDFLFSKNFTPVHILPGHGDETMFLKAFQDPTDAWLAARSVGLSYIPFRRREFSLLKEKESVYGRLLTLNEMNLLYTYKVYNPFIIKVLVDEDCFTSFFQDLHEGLEPEPPEEDEPPPLEQHYDVADSDPLGLDNLPDIWSNQFSGSDYYYPAWCEIRSVITTYDLYCSVDATYRSIKNPPSLGISLDAVGLLKRLRGPIRFVGGSYEINLESQSFDPGGDSDEEPVISMEDMEDFFNM